MIILIILGIILIILASLLIGSYIFHLTVKLFKVDNVKYKISLKIFILYSLFTFIIDIFKKLTTNIPLLNITISILAILVGGYIMHLLLSKYYYSKLKKNIMIYIVFGIFMIVFTIVSSLTIIIPTRKLIIEPFYIKGVAMEPTFYDNDYLLIKKYNKQHARGEVVVFNNPNNNQQYLIKRIIGLPNEKIEITNGEIFIYNNENDKIKLDESDYLAPNILTEPNMIVQLKDKEYFIMGDNRGQSMDSRLFGAVMVYDIIGTVWYRGWPLDKMQRFEAPSYD